MSLKLRPGNRIPPSRGPVLLVVMDGVGIGCGDRWDAVALARTPTLDRLSAGSPYRSLIAHGTAVAQKVLDRVEIWKLISLSNPRRLR